MLIINDVERSQLIKLMGDDYDQMLEEHVLEILTGRQAIVMHASLEPSASS